MGQSGGYPGHNYLFVFVIARVFVFLFVLTLCQCLCNCISVGQVMSPHHTQILDDRCYPWWQEGQWGFPRSVPAVQSYWVEMCLVIFIRMCIDLLQELPPRCSTRLGTSTTGAPPLLRVIRGTIRVSKVSVAGAIPRLMSYCSHSFTASLPTISTAANQKGAGGT